MEERIIGGYDYSPSYRFKSALFEIDTGKHIQYENRVFCVRCGELTGTRVSPFGPVTGPIDKNSEMIGCPKCDGKRR